MPESAATTSRLSTREREIAELVATGKSNRAIAEALYLSERTVERHVSAVFNKLDVHSRAELISAVFAGALQTDAPSPADAERVEAAAQSAAKTNLPSSRTNLVGREAEIADLVSMLGRARLVTVTGAGGVGKTRTALAVGHVLVREIKAGVWLVELASVAQGSFVVAAVARALAVQESPNRPLLETLLAYLKPKTLFLILDNCEHVVAEVAALADALLSGCPNVRVLATSREPVRITGEQTYRLPSLPTPTAGESVGLSAAGAAQYPAVVLFAQRAHAVDHGFVLSDDNAPIVADICRQLDGIPLAIELAAARVKTISPRQLRDRLDERFRVLKDGNRDALPRQQTLRALIDWSHDLLDEKERVLFRRLGVFVNGFTLDGALAVGNGEDFADDFDLLASLVDKSLVVAEPVGDTLRYRLLESTRAYASEKRDAARERDSIACRHLCYLRDLFTDLAVEVKQTAHSTLFDETLSTELPDVRAALDYALLRSEVLVGADLLTRIAVHLGWIGFGHEGVAWLGKYLAVLPRAEPQLLARLCAGMAWLLTFSRSWLTAFEFAAKAVDYARSIDNERLPAWMLVCYARCAVNVGRLVDAELAIAEAEKITSASVTFRLDLLHAKAALSSKRRDLQTASRLYDQLRLEFRSLGEPVREQLYAHHLAVVEHERGNTQAAIDLIHDILPGIRAGRDQGLLVQAFVTLAGFRFAHYDFHGAEAAARDAIELFGQIDASNGNVTIAIEYLACVHALREGVARAATLEGYVHEALARLGYERTFAERASHDRLLELLRDRLDPEERKRCAMEGAALSHEAAITLALRPAAEYDGRFSLRSLS